jgi:hypothetical protein
VIRVYDDAGNVIEAHERASPYLSAVFGSDEMMSFLETRIVSERIKHGIEREQRRSERHT